MPTRSGHGFLLVLAQPAPTMEEEFNAWYDTEHLPERLSVPGFLSGLRFVAIEGGHPRYLAHYDTEGPGTLDSSEYKAVSGQNFSPWTRRVTGRTVVDRRAGVQVWPGDGVLTLAPRLRLLRFDIDDGDEQTLTDTLRTAVESSPGTLSLLICRAEAPTCHYAFIRMSYAETDEAFFPRLGPFERTLGQHVIYAPYDSRPSEG